MAEEGQVIACETVANFREHFQKASDAKKLVVIDFTATWCGPCRIIAPVFAENAKKFPHVVFLKVDVDELSDVAKEYEVEAMPTFLFLKEGKVIERIVGAIKGKIEEAIQKYHCETATA